MNDDKRCCKNCKAGGYVLSLDKVSCTHTENYQEPDYVCDLYRKRENKGIIKKMINENTDDVERFLELMDKFNDDIDGHLRETLRFLTNGISEIYRDKDPNQITMMLQLFISNYCVSLMRTFNNAIIKSLDEIGNIEDYSEVMKRRDKLR